MLAGVPGRTQPARSPAPVGHRPGRSSPGAQQRHGSGSGTGRRLRSGGGSRVGSGRDPDRGRGREHHRRRQRAQQIGVVTIVSTLKYQNAKSAGTGMILSPDGEVLTNNHVIRGATSIVVTVETTGRSYQARSSAPRPARTSPCCSWATRPGCRRRTSPLGRRWRSGTRSSASATPAAPAPHRRDRPGTALDQSITASDENGQDAENLTADPDDRAIQSGDSGGPLYNANGQVVGIDTAASSQRSAIHRVRDPDRQRPRRRRQDRGRAETAAIHIGYPGFLGIRPRTPRAGRGRGRAAQGGPAASAGSPPAR